MEVQPYIETQQQEIVAPYTTVEKSYSPSKWNSKYVSPMELVRLLWHTEEKHQKLGLGERGFLTVLLNHVILLKAKRDGWYEAYPSIETIMSHTGSGDRSTREYKKSLEKKDWVRIESGTGKGRNNHYYINARKIVDCYKLSHPEDDKRYRTGEAYKAVRSSPFPINRNTTNLKQGKSLRC